jgi:dTDP-4-amino-4,6-dideoxygalactose transaminase
MQVPLLDLKAQYAKIKTEIMSAAEELFDSQYFILGGKVAALEKEVASYCSTGYAVGVSSGTDALLISLMALGIGQGDRVITTPYTFFATAGSIARLGAIPVFADIEPGTYNISPSAVASVIDAMSSEKRDSLKAIMPVHLYGQCAEMDPILEIAGRYGLAVVEDAAQAIGSVYRGRRAGSMGVFGCFSFFPSKNLGAFGDGGIVTTRDAKQDEILRILRGHGSKPKYYHKVIGGNFRLDAFQASVVSIKLKYLDEWTRQRQENAGRYRELFEQAGLQDKIELPLQIQERHIYNQFVIRVAANRDELREFLADSKIGTEVYYPVPMHLQECFSYLGHKTGDFPVAEQAARHTLALPIYPELTGGQQEYVVAKIAEFYGD